MHRVTATAALAAIIAAAPAFAPPAFAQTTGGQAGVQVAPLPPEPEGLTLTPFIDIGFAGSLDNSPAGLGVALGYGLDERLTVEGEFAFTPDAAIGAVLDVDSTLWAISGNVLYHFTAENVTPYVTGGLSTLGVNADEDDLLGLEDETEWNLGFNWGGGIKTATSDRFGFRGDLRYFTGDDLVPDHWRFYGGLVIRELGR